MKVSANCFLDPEISGFINANGFEGVCDLKQTIDNPVLETEELIAYFDFVSEVYELCPVGDESGKMLNRILQDHWNLFNLQEVEANLLLRDIFDHRDDDTELAKKLVKVKASLNIDIKSGEHLSNWDSFVKTIKTDYRYVLPNKIELDLDLLSYFASEIKEEEQFYRARIEKDKKLTRKDMGKPPSKITTPGRANPEGIPYLYVSTDLETTLNESRASMLDDVAIGYFTSTQRMTVIDLSTMLRVSPALLYENDIIQDYLVIKPFFEKLSSELSRPVRARDNRFDYIPTQYVCELIKYIGYDAVKYKSAMKENGINLVVFNDEKLKCTKTIHHRVTSINYDHIKL